MKKTMGIATVLVLLLTILVISGCAPAPTPEPTSTPVPSTVTPSPIPPTFTPEPTATLTPTPTPIPQEVLLRWPCGNKYTVRANEPLKIYYGGWGVVGLELSKQWETALVVDLWIDGEPVSGEQHPSVPDLPLSCPKDFDDSYWIYYTTLIPELAPGEYGVRTLFKTLRPLSDGFNSYPEGKLVDNTFKLIVK